MADTETNTPLDADARRLALEAIATLAYVKKIAADQILRPAGVPEDLIQRFIKGRDPATGEALTKRQGGVIILDEMARLGSDRTALRKIINLAAGWNSFHLANNEYEARAVVQKAREFTGVLAEADAREKAEVERAASERVARERRERERTLRVHSALLLAQFDEASAGGDPQQRGYLLQDLLNRVFDLHGLPASRAGPESRCRTVPFNCDGDGSVIPGDAISRTNRRGRMAPRLCRSQPTSSPRGHAIKENSSRRWGTNTVPAPSYCEMGVLRVA